MNNAVHVPVMWREVLQHLELSPGLTVLDGTVGAGGHSRKILDVVGESGCLIGCDRDPMMLEHARQVLTDSNAHLIHTSYRHCQQHLDAFAPDGVDRLLLDLGLSSDQLADRDRGFGFDAGGPLDMRFDVSTGRPAADLLNGDSRDELEELLTTFGEEPYAAQIAERIVSVRRSAPLKTTEDLVSCVRHAVPRNAQPAGKNPATRVFQALRIAVNKELEHVQQMLTDVLPTILKPGGIAVILTFHSLEDRLVKNAFRAKDTWQVLNKRPIEATPAEIRLNPRSRSAKLRAARRSPS